MRAVASYFTLSLKRVPLHYLLKNYCSFGDDDDEDDSRLDGSAAHDIEEDETDGDGMTAMKILIGTNPNCVRAADHRGWLPLHVACGSSSHKGMLRVIAILLMSWPESVLLTTDKDSDVMACVELAGKHHPTKARVIALLQGAKSRASCSNVGDDVMDVQSERSDELERDSSNDEVILVPIL